MRHNVIIHGNVVNTSGADAGELNFLGDGRVTGTIGAAGANNALATVNIGAGAVTLDGNVWAANTKLIDGASILNVGHNVIIHGNVVNTSGADAGELNFLGDGRVTGTIGAAGANNALATVNIGAGAVTLDGNVWAANTKLIDGASILNVGDNVIIHGNVVNTSGADAGELNFLGDGRVTGTIGAAGANNALATVNIGAGAVTLDGNVWAANTKLIDGASILNVENNVTITGNVDNTTGVDNKGVLNFAGVGEVTGAIGATKALAEVNFNGAGNVHLRQAAIAQTFTFNKVATLHAHNNITGNVHFNGHDGTIKLADGKAIDGSITTQGSGKGILTFDGDGEVTRDIGAINDACS